MDDLRESLINYLKVKINEKKLLTVEDVELIKALLEDDKKVR